MWWMGRICSVYVIVVKFKNVDLNLLMSAKVHCMDCMAACDLVGAQFKERGYQQS
jgi:hypothetical protein